MAATAIGRAAAPASGKLRSVFQYQVAVLARFITPMAKAPGRARSASAGKPASSRLVSIGPALAVVLSLRWQAANAALAAMAIVWRRLKFMTLELPPNPGCPCDLARPMP